MIIDIAATLIRILVGLFAGLVVLGCIITLFVVFPILLIFPAIGVSALLFKWAWNY